MLVTTMLFRPVGWVLSSFWLLQDIGNNDVSELLKWKHVRVREHTKNMHNDADHVLAFAQLT